MKCLLIPFVALFATASGFAQAESLRFEDPWVMAVPPVAKETALFVTIVNTGTVPIQIVGGKCDSAKKVVPMFTTHSGGMMGMKDAPSIDVPAGGKTVLKPGGDHLMLIGLKAPLKEGDKVPLSIRVDPGGQTIPLVAPVRKLQPK